MKYTFLVICATTMMTACGSDYDNDWFKHPDKKHDDKPDVQREAPTASIQEIVDSFVHDCGDTYGADLSLLSKLEFIRYGDPATPEAPNVVGICQMWTSDSEIIRSQIVIKEVDPAIRQKALLYHELAHCVLELDHTDQESKTLMSLTMLSNAYYEMNWDELVKDMCLKYPK